MRNRASKTKFKYDANKLINHFYKISLSVGACSIFSQYLQNNGNKVDDMTMMEITSFDKD